MRDAASGKIGPNSRRFERLSLGGREPGSLPSEIFQKLAVRITKVSTRGDPVRASMRQIEKQKPDLVVLATRGRHGLPLWIKPSVAQAIAHRTSAMTLFVPRG